MALALGSVEDFAWRSQPVSAVGRKQCYQANTRATGRPRRRDEHLMLSATLPELKLRKANNLGQDATTFFSVLMAGFGAVGNC